MIGLFFIPLLIVCAYSLLSRGPYGGVMRPWTIDSYRRAFDGLYVGILWRSVWLATVSTAICLVLGFPLALFIARAGRRKTLLLNLVMLPFWTSFLIRTYAWMFLLRDTGLVNSALQSIACYSGATAITVQHGRSHPGPGLRIFAVHGAAALRLA